jgi:hypothetical protein
MRFLVEDPEGVFSLTNKALNLLNFFSQQLTVSFAILFGLLAIIILLIIFKS